MAGEEGKSGIFRKKENNVKMSIQIQSPNFFFIQPQ